MIPAKMAIRGAKIFCKRFGFSLVKAAPDLLIFGGIGSIGAGMYFVAKGTVEAIDIKEEAENKMEVAREIKDDDKRAKEKFEIKKECAWKMFRAFAPAVLFTAAGIGMILAGRGVMRKRYAALQSAYALLNETLENYRDRVREAVGEKKEYMLYNNITEEDIIDIDEKGKVHKKKVKHFNGSGHPLEAIFDEANTMWKGYPGANYYTLMAARSTANNKLFLKGYLTLAEVLEDLRMPVPDYALYMGWIKDPNNSQHITFGMEANYELRDGKETNAILKFNCDGNIMDKLADVQREKYGYSAMVA